MKQVYLTRQAEENLDEIFEPLYSEILAKIQLIKEFPYLGQAMEGSFIGYRHMPVHVFRIIYRIMDSDEIEIAYIRHCKRRLAPSEHP